MASRDPAEIKQSIAKLGKLNLSILLIEVGAWFGEGDIPVSLFGEWTNMLGFIRTRFTLDGLRRNGLITLSKNSYLLDPQVKLASREMQQADGSADHNLLVAVVQLCKALPGDVQTDLVVWPVYDQLQPHLLSVFDWIGDRTDINPHATAHAMDRLATRMQTRGEMGPSLALFERAVAIAEVCFRDDQKSLAFYLNDYAVALEIVHKYDQAKPLVERALKINKAMRGSNDTEVASGLNTLGNVLRGLGDLDGARTAFEEALKIDEAHGPNGPRVGDTLSNLGSLLRKLRDYDGALRAYERAIHIHEAAFGPNHPDVAVDINNLGAALYDKGDMHAAEAAFKRAQGINMKHFGPAHPAVRTTASWLAKFDKD